MQVHVITASWAEHKPILRKIRGEVFIEEQNVPQELEWDDEDERATHFLAISEFGQHIGCARLTANGQIGRMAVTQQYRGTGIGAQLLDAAVAQAQTQGMGRVFLHAQAYAEAFYRKGGFVPYGAHFTEAGIDHVAMEMMLPIAYEPLDVGAKPAIKPESEPARAPSAPLTISGLSDCANGLNKIIDTAQRRLLIMSPYLDHDLFDTPALVERVSQMARHSPRAEVQILILSSKLIIDRGHQLVELARRLDEKITIRRLDERPGTETSSFVCADTDAYWLLPNHEEYDGVCDVGNPVTTARLAETFQLAWRRSVDDPELRTLRL